MSSTSLRTADGSPLGRIPPPSLGPPVGRARSSPRAAALKRGALVAAATLIVAGVPVAVVCWLRATREVSSVWLCAILAMAVSLLVSWAARALWERRSDSEDLLFNELLLWGFLHRWHTQRRVARAASMLQATAVAHPAGAEQLGVRSETEFLQGLVAELETRDPYLHGHSRRVARHSSMIARWMGLSREQTARIRTAAAIHDIGKLGTPRAILHKPGPLDDAEYEVIKRHPGAGARMAGALGDPELTAIVRHHHERLNGTGYPDGLAGEEIPLGARIIAVADTFDAVTSLRPYRAASPHRKALEILREDAGVRLDPAAVNAFCGHYAGWRPLAAWGLAAALPEWLAASLAGGVAGIVSAARVPALAALLGGVAASASAPALTHAQLHRATAQAGLRAGLLSHASPDRARSVIAAPAAPRTRRGRPERPRHGGGTPSPSPRQPARTGAQAPAPSEVAGGTRGQSASPAQGASSAGASEQLGSPGSGAGAGGEVLETVGAGGGGVGETGAPSKAEEALASVKETAAASVGAAGEAAQNAAADVEALRSHVQAPVSALP